MAEPARRTVCGFRRACRHLGIVVLVLSVVSTACAGRNRRPRTLAALGASLAVGGSGVWVAGERLDHSALTSAGFATVLAGVAAMVVAGGWMASAVGCHADPDCADDEQCREIPAPPGGIPYKQCMPR